MEAETKAIFEQLKNVIGLLLLIHLTITIALTATIISLMSINSKLKDLINNTKR
jgi:hypothetical protein